MQRHKRHPELRSTSLQITRTINNQVTDDNRYLGRAGRVLELGIHVIYRQSRTPEATYPITVWNGSGHVR